MELKDWYSIHQVAQLTGLSTQRIRKWEERYRAVEPRRLENGYRVYSARDVMRLKQLQKLTEEGYAIRNAVIFLEQSSFAPASAQVQDAPSVREDASFYSVQPQQTEWFLDLLLTYGGRGESRQIQDLLQKVYARFGLRYLSDKLVIPFLTQVGERWQARVWNEYQEHFASTAVRDFLIKAYSALSAPRDAPLLLAACLPGERHEIMLHLTMLEAVMSGYQVAFLGVSPAPGALADAAIHLHPQVAALSLVTQAPLETYPHMLNEINQLASRHRDTQFFIGGAAAKALLAKHELHWLQYAASVPSLFKQVGPTRI